ncbi:carbohydrate ABC transporter substrate-binding protein [Alginatibacterium sediminis]|uniref:Probable sugar-binding periplasmic protein n=2 Tax=Alginatibacterium sediminis TaxID=2164068 RepID=A0A420ENR6_9ALTE|nr:carbohydrate ABC transporter substrate-binding protein [Alginatibacterium sediminis]
MADEIELLHWWTSKSEAGAVLALEKAITEQGYTWKPFSISGGGGENAMTVLKTRAISGNPPTAAQIKGDEIKEWAKLSFLMPLDGIAAEQDWEAIIPPIILERARFEDHFYAVPFNIHRVNWLWANPMVFEQAGAEIPHSIEAFFVAADKLEQAGFIPLAHGLQDWQNATIFEAIALSVLGHEKYLKAFFELDASIIESEDMVQVFKYFKQIRSYIDKGARNRQWNEASQLLIQGKAGMQIMGDWAKGEFTASGKVPGVDIVCAAVFGTDDMFSLNSDSLAIFKGGKGEDSSMQLALAKAVLDKDFQIDFNRHKGSIPVRQDIDLSDFDTCSQESSRAFKQGELTGALVPSFAHGLANSSAVQNAIFDIVNRYFNNPEASPEQTVLQLSRAVKAVR